MKFLDQNHPFFAKAWVRWATVLFATGWGVMEFLLGSPGWGVVFCAAGAYAFYVLIYIGPDQG